MKSFHRNPDKQPALAAGAEVTFLRRKSSTAEKAADVFCGEESLLTKAETFISAGKESG